MTSSFLLLQNEGFLMRSCFKTSLTALRAWRGEAKGPFYVAFFNYTIGLERLLKVLLLMKHWHHNRVFPTDRELKSYGGKYGHDIEILYESATNLLQQYGVERKSNLERDDIDRKLLAVLSSFGQRSRYYNLYTLTDPKAGPDPLGIFEDLLREIFEKDVPAHKRPSEADEVDVLVDTIEGNVCVKSTVMGCTLHTESEHRLDQRKLALALPEMCWRLVKLLAPLQALMIAIHEGICEKDHRIDGEASVPYMQEFMEDFVCEDRNVILESEDWP